MPITGLPTDAGDNIVTVTPTGFFDVDAGAGTDLLRVLYGSLTTDVEYRPTGFGWYTFTDDMFSGINVINFERFEVRTGSGDDAVSGRDGDDILVTGAGNDDITTGLGADTVDGGAGQDIARVNWSSVSGDVVLNLHPTNAVTVGATGASFQRIEALDITTGVGDDRIDTRRVTGDDNVRTGDGDDSFATAGGIDRYDAGAGRDRLIVDYSAATQSVRHVNEGFGWFRIEEKTADGPKLSYYGVEVFDLTGGSGNDTLQGGDDNDRLTGNDGDDWLNSGGGIDTVDGGAGIDTWQVNYSSAPELHVVNLVTQTTNGGAVLSGIEAIHYTGCVAEDRVVALPGVFDDWFATGDGEDQVTTGRGVDRADGGGGIDLLRMDWSAISDPLDGIVHRNEGFGWYSYSSTSDDRLDFYGFELFDLAGGAGRDSLAGGSGNDTLRGGAGNDTLNSAQGKDVVDGGAGDDLWVADLRDVTRPVTFNASLSQTKVQGGTSGVKVTGIESVDLKTGAGKDRIVTSGYALDDRIESGAGNDTIDPGLGVNSVNGGDGTDQLIVDLSSAVTDVNVTNIGFGWYRIGDAADTSHTDFYAMERFAFTGGSGDDYLEGRALNDRLTGGAGDDTLNGASGKDAIDGKAGNDLWIADYSAATKPLTLVMSAAGAGTLVGVGTTLKSVENLQLTTGKVNDRVDLSALSGDDNISTGDGNDVVDLGRGRHDMANGGNGQDVLIADGSLAEAGLRTYATGFGWTTMRAKDGSYVLDHYGFEQLNLTGGAFNDRLNGFGGNDTLSGGAGQDILNGGGGDDVLTGGAGADQFRFEPAASAGVDRITDADAGDFLRLVGIALTGPVQSGDGTGLGAGRVAAQISAGQTVLHVGLDSVAGADFRVVLEGSFGLGDFALSGSDILIL